MNDAVPLPERLEQKVIIDVTTDAAIYPWLAPLTYISFSCGDDFCFTMLQIINVF